MNKAMDFKGWRPVSQSLFMVLALIFVWATIGLAQDFKADPDAFIQETSKSLTDKDEVTMMFWMPEEFWKVTDAGNPYANAAFTEEITKVFRPYIVLLVCTGKMGPFGGITYSSEETIRAAIQIRDGKGNRYRPLHEDALSADTKNFLLMIKPLFANMFGQMGQNLRAFLFPAKDEAGDKIAEAKKEGVFWVELGGKEFRWRLPLGSLFAPKICPTCVEKLSGAYKFCPWDGTKLPDK
jgi:hypothetical protein